MKVFLTLLLLGSFLFADVDNKMLKHGQLTIESTLMTEEEAKLLDSSLPSAAFYLEHLFYDFNDRPISWGWFIFPSDQLHFTTFHHLQIALKIICGPSLPHTLIADG